MQENRTQRNTQRTSSVSRNSVSSGKVQEKATPQSRKRRAGEPEAQQKVKSTGYYDYSVLFIILCLSLFGLVMVYSTTAYSDASVYGNEWFTTRKQAIFTLAALVAVVGISKWIDYHFYPTVSLFLMIGVIALLVVVLVTGTEANGSARWINLGFISIQPSEFAKPILVMFITRMYYSNYQELSKNRELQRGKSLLGNKKKKYPFDALSITIVIPCVIVIGLVLVENLSTGIILTLITFFMMYVANKRRGVYYGLAVLGIIAIALVIYTDILSFFLKDYQLVRIKAWLNPEAYEQDGGYQILQGLYAVGSGGFFGKGLGYSIQKLGYLPEAQNDMVFAIICEELGVFGALLVLILFAFLLWRILLITVNAPDFVGFMLGAGIFVHIALQVCMNVAVVTNSMPNTGVSLPFISSGGSSLIVCMGEMAILLNISKHIKIEK